MRGDVSNRFLVFNQQDLLARTFRSLGGSVLRRSRQGLPYRRQVEFESRTQARKAVNFDMAPTLFNNALDDRQSESGAMTQCFGGEKRFKDVRLHFRAHAAAGVGDGQEHVKTWPNRPVGLE